MRRTGALQGVPRIDGEQAMPAQKESAHGQPVIQRVRSQPQGGP
jgi:hypothetical protein